MARAPADGSIRPTDEELCAALPTDRQALAELYARYGRRLYGWAAVQVGQERAEDVVQNVFLEVLGSAPRLRGPSFCAWLFGVAHHVLADEVRRRPGAPLPAPDRDGARAIEERMRIGAALGRLPRRQRQAILLHFLADLSLGDTAVALHASPGATKALLHRATVAMGRLLGGERSRRVGMGLQIGRPEGDRHGTERRLRQLAAALEPDPATQERMRGRILAGPPRRRRRTGALLALVPLVSVLACGGLAAAATRAAVGVWPGALHRAYVVQAPGTANLPAVDLAALRVAGAVPRGSAVALPPGLGEGVVIFASCPGVALQGALDALVARHNYVVGFGCTPRALATAVGLPYLARLAGPSSASAAQVLPLLEGSLASPPPAHWTPSGWSALAYRPNGCRCAFAATSVPSPQIRWLVAFVTRGGPSRA